MSSEIPLKQELQPFVEGVREMQTPMVGGEAAKRALDLAFEITRQVQAASVNAKAGRRKDARQVRRFFAVLGPNLKQR